MAYGTPALAALVVVAIYEGKAYLASAPENGGRALVDTRPAGNDDREIGQAGLPLAAAGELPKSSAPAAASKGGQSASQLDNVKGKLAAVQREKRDLEVQLRSLEKELAQRAASPPGGKADEFDLNREDWKELAAQGRIKYRIPCMLPPESAYSFPQDELDELGLSPDDGPLLIEARRRSNAPDHWSHLENAATPEAFVAGTPRTPSGHLLCRPPLPVLTAATTVPGTPGERGVPAVRAGRLRICLELFGCSSG